MINFEEEIAQRDARIAELEAIIPIESELRAKAERAAAELERELAALKAQQPSAGVVPDALSRTFITGESGDASYRVVIKAETLEEMQQVHNWLASINSPPISTGVADDNARLRAELAALKAGHGEPVAYMKSNSPIEGHTEFCKHELWMLDDNKNCMTENQWVPLYTVTPASTPGVQCKACGDFGSDCDECAAPSAKKEAGQ